MSVAPWIFLLSTLKWLVTHNKKTEFKLKSRSIIDILLGLSHYPAYLPKEFAASWKKHSSTKLFENLSNFGYSAMLFQQRIVKFQASFILLLKLFYEGRITSGILAQK